MLRVNFLLLAMFFSVLIHFSIISFMQTYKDKKENEIFVMDLSTFREFKPEVTPQKKL